MNQISRGDIDKYMNAAQSAMLQYQMIEQALKTYIFHAHKVVQFCLPRELGFSYKENEYDSMPLERLLNTFAKFTYNKPLLKQLNALKESRNYIAHRSFALAVLSSVSQRINFDHEFTKVSEANTASLNAFIALKDELDSISQLSARLKEEKNGY